MKIYFLMNLLNEEKKYDLIPQKLRCVCVCVCVHNLKKTFEINIGFSRGSLFFLIYIQVPMICLMSFITCSEAHVASSQTFSFVSHTDSFLFLNLFQRLVSLIPSFRIGNNMEHLFLDTKPQHQVLVCGT